MMDSTRELKQAESRNTRPAKTAFALIISLLGVIASFAFSFYLTQAATDSHEKFSFPR